MNIPVRTVFLHAIKGGYVITDDPFPTSELTKTEVTRGDLTIRVSALENFLDTSFYLWDVYRFIQVSIIPTGEENYSFQYDEFVWKGNWTRIEEKFGISLSCYPTTHYVDRNQQLWELYRVTDLIQLILEQNAVPEFNLWYNERIRAASGGMKLSPSLKEEYSQLVRSHGLEVKALLFGKTEGES